jgi:histidine phosphotransfer protein HptB
LFSRAGPNITLILPADMSPETPIDPEAIENLRALTPDDPDSFLRDIIGIFLDDTPARIADLRQSLASGEKDAFTRAAHSIKGSASNLGATQLRAISSELEQRGKVEPVAGLATRVDDLDHAFNAAKQALEKLLPPV